MADRYHPQYNSSAKSDPSPLKFGALANPRRSNLLDPKTGSKTRSHNLGSLVKKLVEKKSKSAEMTLVIPSDLIAEDARKNKITRTESGFSGLQKRLFRKEKKPPGALTEAKPNCDNTNTRSLAMVLRSERDLLSANKKHELEISALKSMLDEKNREIEKLKDLCLKQKEEMKELKTAILFPDDAKLLVPTLQQQVTSLTGQLQSLALDLAEVKADRHAREWIHHSGNSPFTPAIYHEAAANSYGFSSCEAADNGSPDDMFLHDLNPCLTPRYSKISEFDATCNHHIPHGGVVSERTNSCISSLQRNAGSDCCACCNSATRRSDGNGCKFASQMCQKVF